MSLSKPTHNDAVIGVQKQQKTLPAQFNQREKATKPMSEESPAKQKWVKGVESLTSAGGDVAWGVGGGNFWNLVNSLGSLQKVAGEKVKVTGLADGGLEVAGPEEWTHESYSTDAETETDSGSPTSEEGGDVRDGSVPTLNVVIMVVGTRGDVQPFIALGRELKEFGHRVRLASHATYREFVTGSGLEFYPLGGDPRVLSEYVVRNRGVVPTRPQDIPENLQQLNDIIFSTYDACTKPDPEGDGEEFEADAIISNPPTYGHIHCAEKLGIPLHMMFTMPWSKTKEFMHPLARMTRKFTSWIQQTATFILGSAADAMNRKIQRRMNKNTYHAVENLMYLGVKSMIDDFRVNVLGLKSTELFNSELRHILHTKRVPFTYCWSPSLVPKPKDWGSHIDVVGFFFLAHSSLSNYTPPEELQAFLDAGKPPVYIGFGSMVIPEPEKINKAIQEAVDETEQRMIVSKGWGGLGEGLEGPNIFVVGNCPHDWLFPRCSGVIHHGGAGTTAAGLLTGCPTFIVPFFGDQPFWGQACYKAGVGPEPLKIDDFNSEELVKALGYMRLPKVENRVALISEAIQGESGVRMAVECFHKHLPPEDVIRERKVNWKME